ncbi:putative LuxR family transcriptional regulator [Gordonia effusa NBRC 100432]|uniref:Putative LuxR family transcriptional regulator n=1 Tax=Gordonia effusa NBRC 100432 TaxID=1077974 RepID=H0R173_9ACTN|nr:LuxR C-terminal-related transcriptional regulator [Gordonia effusa]GAB18824.1 putative LuxR family transcriptional regulator [Gordonia effusa NBRC 100432]
MIESDLMRPNDVDAVRGELREAGRLTGLPVLFGGLVVDDRLTLSGFIGTRGAQLRGLVVPARCGLGGRAVAERRPGAVVDYAGSGIITHEYDVEVASEGIVTLLAAPAVVDGRARAVIYGGLRSAVDVGDAVLGLLSSAARRLAREFEVRDEVDRRLALIDHAAPEPVSPELADRVIESVVALRELAASTQDAVLAERLLDIGNRLGAADASTESNSVRLSPRESEVLAYVALGCGNAEIARRLGLRPESVKSYLRNVFGKLGTRNRHEAVRTARRLRLMP